MDNWRTIDTNDIIRVQSVNNLSYGIKRAIRKLNKEVELYNKYIVNKMGARSYIKTHNIKKVQIGSGQHRLYGWINLDLERKADVCWDVREGLPFKNNSLDTVFSEHTLEHLDYPTSVKKLFKETYRCLESGGVFIIGVPDMELAIRMYAKRDKNYFTDMLKKWYKNRKNLPHFNTYIDLINYISRDEDDDEKYTPHLWAYDYEKLKQLAEEAGFSNVKKWTFNPKIANPKRQWGSVYITCNKKGEKENA